VGLRPSGDEPGYVLTRPFVVPESASLTVNATVNEGGTLRAELRTDNNKTIDGFTLDDCAPVGKGGFAETITWGEKKLDAVVGQELRLRFELRDAAIFTYGVE
jgi:hypothetical protein